MAGIEEYNFKKIVPEKSKIVAGKSSFPEQIKSVKIDSRKCTDGCLFVGLPGEQTHGHNFTGDAASSGAVAAIVEEEQSVAIPQLVVPDSLEALQELARNFRDIIKSQVIGITGSCGKTTVKEMLAELVATGYSVGKTPGNYNNHIGLPLTVLNEGGREILVAEVATNQPGEIEKLTSILRPEMGIITHIGPAHLEGLGSVEKLAEEKSDLLAGLPESGIAIVPEDLRYMDKIEAFSAVEPIKVGSTDQADFRVSWRLASEGAVMEVEGRKINLSLDREELLRDAALSFCAAEKIGVKKDNLQEGFKNLSALEGRGEIEKIFGCMVIDGSYNANPDSVISALEYIESLPAPRLAVLGDMLELGDSAPELHCEIGKKLAEIPEIEIHYVGEFGKEIAENFEGNAPLYLYENVEEIMDLTPRGFNSALVKSSHAVGLHRLVDSWRDNQ